MARRLMHLRAAVLFASCIAVERGLTTIRGKADAWNYLSATGLVGGALSFASGQFRRGLLVTGSLSIIGLPLYLALTTGWVDAAISSLEQRTKQDAPNEEPKQRD